ncbi:hypothetical protein HNQ82_002146 [Anoxybacillus tengchongensis]|uniref:Uncharacterized protein n=1 Tax=Anoxybacillus tengchongensis TaxID=576944 RepID=A0A7W9YS15_9BACL|nr:hypothetical protein [Anoxybacillus tengchongensis]MBB6177313.1 hypothetical protein [Anoxybacillus tengchongensis]
MDRISFAEQMWEELLSMLYEGKVVSTFKGKATFTVVSFSDNGIEVRIASKTNEKKSLSRKVMMNAIYKLIDHIDGVRQKMVDPESRLKLGLLSLLPSTEKVRKVEAKRSVLYLILTSETRKKLTE